MKVYLQTKCNVNLLLILNDVPCCKIQHNFCFNLATAKNATMIQLSAFCAVISQAVTGPSGPMVYMFDTAVGSSDMTINVDHI